MIAMLINKTENVIQIRLITGICGIVRTQSVITKDNRTLTKENIIKIEEISAIDVSIIDHDLNMIILILVRITVDNNLFEGIYIVSAIYKDSSAGISLFNFIYTDFLITASINTSIINCVIMLSSSNHPAERQACKENAERY